MKKSFSIQRTTGVVVCRSCGANAADTCVDFAVHGTGYGYLNIEGAVDHSSFYLDDTEEDTDYTSPMCGNCGHVGATIEDIFIINRVNEAEAVFTYEMPEKYTSWSVDGYRRRCYLSPSTSGMSIEFSSRNYIVAPSTDYISRYDIENMNESQLKEILKAEDKWHIPLINKTSITSIERIDGVRYGTVSHLAGWHVGVASIFGGIRLEIDDAAMLINMLNENSTTPEEFLKSISLVCRFEKCELEI